MGHISCFAKARKDEWEAICIDYDIAVEGRSFDEVCSLLSKAVVSYIEDARAEAPDQAKHLLSRRAPRWAWFRWAITGHRMKIRLTN